MLGIQADDLTGACDTGAAFAARGLDTVVLFPGAPGPPAAPDVLILDTESRALDPGRAGARAREAAARLAAGGAALLYKKVDSTLRGAVGAEVAGARAGAARPLVLLAPAFPAQARTVQDGVLRVAGRPADETPIGADPTFPATGASVLALGGAGGPHPVAALPLSTLRRGVAAVRARLARALDTGGGLLVADAETDADLEAVAAAAGGLPALLAGSAGLARVLARGLPARPAPSPVLRRPLLVVAGSAHPATRAQLDRLAGRPGAEVLAAPPGGAAGTPAARRRVAADLADRARQRWERPGPAGPPRTLVLTGGETALAVARALGASGLRLAGEAEPGIAVGALLDGPRAGLAVVTKAGGFGDPDALVRLLEAAAA
jgi:uncharacterized protein YgbK (DUF1537 family)